MKLWQIKCHEKNKSKVRRQKKARRFTGASRRPVRLEPSEGAGEVWKGEQEDNSYGAMYPG